MHGGSRTAGVEASRIEPISRLKVSDSVAAQLERLITTGIYKTGDKLPPERTLAEQFGVGRSSMREAIRMLEASGLVATSHGVGVFVVNTTPRDAVRSELLILDRFTVVELFEVRHLIEPEAAALSARRISASEAADLMRLLQAASDPRLPGEVFASLDNQLHTTIVRATKNRLLLQLYTSLAPLLLEYSRRVLRLPGRRAHAHKDHTALVDAIIGHRVREARAEALNHLRDVEQDIVAALGQSPDGAPRPPYPGDFTGVACRCRE